MLYNCNVKFPHRFKQLRRKVLPFFVGGLVVLIPIVYFSFKHTKPVAADWYNDSWAFRKMLTVDNSKVSGSTDFTDFTVLVSLSSDSDLSANAQADGDDIVFTGTDGQKLSHELVSYSAGTLQAWVKIPTLYTDEDTSFYMYYGNPTAAAQQTPRNTWDKDYKGVWHLEEEASGTGNNDTYNDSSFTSNEGDDYVSDTGQTGKIGNGQQFDGSNDYIVVGGDAKIDSGSSGSISAWINPDAHTTDVYIIFGVGGAAASNAGEFSFYIYDGQLGVYQTTDGSSAADDIDTGDIISASTWQYVTLTSDGSTWRFYRNGVEQSVAHTYSGSNSGDWMAETSLTSTITNVIGRVRSNGNYAAEFDGFMDEVRVTSATLSEDWLLTEYNNQNSPSTFYSTATQEIGPGPVLNWALDESTGSSANDTSSSGLTGTITNAVWRGADYCLSSACLFMDGTGDYVSVADSALLDFDSSDDFTVQAWIRHGPISGSADVILSKLEASGTDGGYELSMQSDGDLQFEIDDNDGDTTTETLTTTTANYDDGKWHFVVATKEGTTEMNLYVDGRLIVQDTTISETTTLANDDGFYVGMKADGSSNGFAGFIDDVSIYPFVRTASEILSDYNGGPGASDIQAFFGKNSDSLQDSLVGYWPADEKSVDTCTGGSNDICDKSGNVNDGAYNGGTLTNTVSKFGDAIGPNTSEYVSVADSNSLDISDEITLASWVYRDNTNNDNTIFFKGTSASNYNYALTLSTTAFVAYPTFSFYNGSEVTHTSTTAIADDQWTHVAATYDGQNVRLYIDGELVYEEAETTALVTDSGSLSIGTNDLGAEDLEGDLDEMRIYSRALSSEEVRDLYNWAPGPAGYWRLDENTGTSTVYDVSESGNDGTMNGTMTTADWVKGKFGSALELDDSNDYISLATEDGEYSNDIFTIGAWVYRYSDSGATEMIIDNRDGASDGYGMEIAGSSDQMICRYNATALQPTSTTISTDTWTHIACSSDGSTLKAYKDGTMIGSTSISGSISETTDMTFGRTSYTSSNFGPTILDEVKVYTYTRSDDQIIEDMNGGHPVGGSPIGSQIAYWAFDEQFGQNANDTIDPGVTGILGSSAGSDSADPTWTAQTSCKLNACLDFDGSGDYVDFNDNHDFEDGEDFTITGWFSRGSYTTDDTIIAKKNDQTGNTAGYIVWIDDSNDTLAVDLSDGGGTFDHYQFNTISTFTDSTWHHFAVVVDEDSTAGTTIYIDGHVDEFGFETGSLPGTGSLANTVDLRVGSESDAGEPFDGTLDEIKIYSAALTQDQIIIDLNSNSGMNFGAGYDEKENLVGGAGSDPVVHFAIDENTGTSTIYDTSGNGLTGSLAGSMTESDWVRGKYGSALEFDGSDDRIDIGDTGGFDDMSVAAWVKTTAASAQTVVSKWSTATDGKHWDLSLTSSGYVQFRIRVTDGDNPGNYAALGTTSINDGKFHHIMGVRNGTSLYTYIDGVLDATYSSAPTGTLSITENAFLGRRSVTSPTNYFAGSIDEVKIWDYALDASQIAYDFNRGNPLGWWQFDECTGAVANDASGNGNSGTITPNTSGTNTSVGNCSSGNGDEMWDNGTTGAFNASLHFDGTNDYVDMGDPSSGKLDFGTNPFSIAVWAKTSSSGLQTIVSKVNTSTNNGFSLRLDTSSVYPEIILDDDTGSRAIATTAINDGEWHHIAATRNGTSLKIYVDGKLEAEDSISAALDVSGAESLNIGRREVSAGGYFSGQIDDVRLYNYELTAEQIGIIMNEGGGSRFGTSIP